MMMTARCKFTVESVTHHAYGGRTVSLAALYDQPLSQEDRAFSNATPSGKMEIVIQNERVFDVFAPGKKVYVDVTPVE
jgi:hypothetical protein